MQRTQVALLAICLTAVSSAVTYGENVPFDADHWDLSQAVVTQHLERTALAGFALLRDVEFEDGVKKLAA